MKHVFDIIGRVRMRRRMRRLYAAALIYGHVNPYGVFRLDMDTRLAIDPEEASAA